MTNKKFKIYVAGKLNDMAVGYIQNAHRMIQWAEYVRKAGFSVYVPAYDFLGGLVCGNWFYEDYFDNSQPWLEAADALFLVPGYEGSNGTKKEIERAKACGVPVFKDIEDMINYFRIR